MFRVIDTSKYDDMLQRNRPELVERIRKLPGVTERFCRALLVILDPLQVASAPVQPGATVRVHRPDGRAFDLVVSAVDVRHSVVGLFFRDTADHEIPRLSEIELLAVNKTLETN
jgi:hypothetical protein